MGLSQERYMMFTSHRRDGRAVGTPVWVVGLGEGKVGFSTGGDSAKVKRIRRDPAVTVQPCDARGSATHGELRTGTAEVVRGAEVDPILAAIRAKYRIMSAVLRVVGLFSSRFSRGERVGIVVTLDPAAQ